MWLFIFLSGNALGYFTFQVNDGMNYGHDDSFEILAEELEIISVNNAPLEVFPATTQVSS